MLYAYCQRYNKPSIYRTKYFIFEEKMADKFYLPLVKVQDVCCDATSSKEPVFASFFCKAHFFNELNKGRVYTDFILQIKESETSFLGEWKCRISCWLQESVSSISSPVGFEYYKMSFRVAHNLATLFVNGKYTPRINGNERIVLPYPNEQELLVQFQSILSNEN